MIDREYVIILSQIQKWHLILTLTSPASQYYYVYLAGHCTGAFLDVEYRASKFSNFYIFVVFIT